MTSSPLLLLAGFTLAMLGACSTIPLVPLGKAELAEAQSLYQTGDYGAADRALRNRDRDHFDRHSQGAFSLLAGDIAWAREDWDRAILHYQEYLLFEGAARTSERVEERLFKAGMQLLNGDRRAFGIFTDRTRGARVLTDLAMWSPRSPWADEALINNANWYFDERQFGLAAESYRMILQEHAGSEFTDHATYLLGMCSYYRITGPWLEEKLIVQAENQLNFYLGSFPNGLYRDQAKVVVEHLAELSAERELKIGDYYATIGNTRGARRHYLEASTRSGTKIAAIARKKLEQLTPEDEADSAANNY